MICDLDAADHSLTDSLRYSKAMEHLPIPSERSHGKDIVEQFSNMLE